MESIMIQLSLDFFSFLFHRSKCSPMHPVLKPLNYLCSSKLHPYKNWYCYMVKLFLTLALVITMLTESVAEEAEWAQNWNLAVWPAACCYKEWALLAPLGSIMT
jgi:hypothetical protein